MDDYECNKGSYKQHRNCMECTVNPRNPWRDANYFNSRAPQTTHQPASVVPTTAELIQLHQIQGRYVTREHVFGKDPLEDVPELQDLRRWDFLRSYPRMEEVFQNVLHSDGSLFR